MPHSLSSANLQPYQGHYGVIIAYATPIIITTFYVILVKNEILTSLCSRSSQAGNW